MATLDADAILTAIRDVLDLGAGSLRTITAGFYSGSAYPGMAEEELSRRALVKPRIETEIKRMKRNPSSPPRNGSVGIWNLEILVHVYRHLNNDHKLTDATRDNVKALAAQDADVISQALEYPGNLNQDAGANATGLAGQNLLHEDSELVRMKLTDGEAGLIETLHRFKGIVTVTQAVS